MNLEVVGRHALLFDDDAMALFVNSEDALVDWNSLAIDRYDVRHLLSGPPPPRKRRSPPSAEPDLDYERWLDLPCTSNEEQLQVQQAGIKSCFRHWLKELLLCSMLLMTLCYRCVWWLFLLFVIEMLLLLLCCFESGPSVV